MEMTTPYDVLIPWCQSEAAAGLTDEQRLAALRAETLTVLRPTPVSFRTLMDHLDPTDYCTARAVMNAAAEQNALIADAVKIMANVGPWEESGLDFGSSKARTLIDALFGASYPAIAATMKAIAETQTSQLAEWGVTVELGHLQSAREYLEAQA